MICAWGYSSVGERSVRIRKAVSSNLIISIKQPARIERWIPVPGARVRFLSDVLTGICIAYPRFTFLQQERLGVPAVLPGENQAGCNKVPLMVR